VKTDHLITKFLQSELSDESKAKMGRLIKSMNSDDEKSRYEPLIDSIKTDKTIQFVFNHIEIPSQTKEKQQYAGYLDTAGVMLAFSISRRTLSEWCKKKVLHCHVFGCKHYFRVKDVENLFLKNYTGFSATPSTKSPVK